VGRTGRGEKKGEAYSFCSSEEKELLEEIEDFITKPIEEMKVSKKGYAEVVRTPDTAEQDLKALVAEHDAWISGKKSKKKRKKK